MMVLVAPTALPMDSARCPALRPWATTKYQRWVVFASTIRFLTISTPTWRAVWKPKVLVSSGRSMSLSIVLGTWITRIFPRVFSEMICASVAVPSPPMVMSMPTPSRSRASSVRWRCSGERVGLAREMPMYEPPRKWMRLVSSMVRGTTWEMSPSESHLKPSWMPMTSTPRSRARMVAAPITLLMPGAGPPATTMASFFMAPSKPKTPSRSRHLPRSRPSVLTPAPCSHRSSSCSIRPRASPARR